MTHSIGPLVSTCATTRVVGCLGLKAITLLSILSTLTLFSYMPWFHSKFNGQIHKLFQRNVKYLKISRLPWSNQLQLLAWSNKLPVDIPAHHTPTHCSQDQGGSGDYCIGLKFLTNWCLIHSSLNRPLDCS